MRSDQSKFALAASVDVIWTWNGDSVKDDGLKQGTEFFFTCENQKRGGEDVWHVYVAVVSSCSIGKKVLRPGQDSNLRP